jgi:sulfatase modifying factor 1
MLKPTGFWSYTSSDDTASRGRLSQLRRLLADELQLKIGRTPKVHIFQDVAAIPHGTDWLKEIHRALGDSSFLIPIVTPAFLQSEMCCAEVARFRQREMELGRDDLIFPFHYIGVEDINPDQPGECHDAAVLKLLRSRQWIDFRLLRFRNTDDEAVALKLESFADSIRAALRRDTLPRTTALPIPASRPPTDSPIAIVTVVPAALAPGSVMRDGPAYPEMVLIPPGRFIMGVPKDESARERGKQDDWARPQHEVTIPHVFYLGKYPITRAEFATFVADTGHEMPSDAWTYEPDKQGEWASAERSGRDWREPGFPQTDRDPVVCVRHADAEAYAAWLSRKTGHRYRLPSEAEWEYAARAGTQTARFWGNDRESAYRYANVADETLRQLTGEAEDPNRFFPGKDGFAFTSPVGSFLPNHFGLYDMLGNVFEWTADHWHDDYKRAPADGSAWTTGGDATWPPVPRGGCWRCMPEVVRAGYRQRFFPRVCYSTIGFRVAKSSFSSGS